MNYATIKEFDIANGPGIRTSVFVSGCDHACKGCFNYEVWDYNYGEEFTYDIIDKVVKLVKRDFISGLSLLGGEPLAPKNQEWVLKLVKKVKEEVPNKDIWCYSGYTYEYIIDTMYPNLPYIKEIIENIDVLVDGKWIEELKDLNLKFRGSSNQRIIKLKK